VAAACDKIWASPGTITGSIGVISQLPHVHKLLELTKVEVDTIKSGALKDVGSPFRPMSPEERAYFQKFTDGIYDQFLDDVVKGRKLEKEKLRKLADGRIFSGREAKELGLVDELGNLEDAIEGAAKLAGLSGEPVPMFKRRPGHGLLGELLKGAAETLTPRGSVELRDPRL
jgi:protease-4